MEITTEIMQLAEEVQRLLDCAYASVGEPVAGSALDQLGLRDGSSIVRDYLAHGEAGVAFDHLLYMITEPDLELSSSAYSSLVGVGREMAFSSDLWRDIRHVKEA